MSEIPKDVWKIATKVWSEAEGKIITIDSQAVIAKAISAERTRCAKIAADEAEYAMETYEGARLHDFLSVSRHIEAQILMKPHQRDKMRGISYASQAILNQTEE